MSAIIDHEVLEYDNLPYPVTTKEIFDWRRMGTIVVKSIDICAKRGVEPAVGNEAIAPDVRRPQQYSANRKIIANYLTDNGPTKARDIAKATGIAFDTARAQMVRHPEFSVVAPAVAPLWKVDIAYAEALQNAPLPADSQAGRIKKLLEEQGPLSAKQIEDALGIGKSSVKGELEKRFRVVQERQPPRWSLSKAARHAEKSKVIRYLSKHKKASSEEIATGIGEPLNEVKQEINRNRRMFETDGGCSTLWGLREE